jgi:hypothetical protein
MAAFGRRHSYRGTKTPAQLLARLRATPTAPVGLPSTTLASMIGVQVALLQALQGGPSTLGARSTPAPQGHHRLRPQRPPTIALGGQALRRCPSTRQAQPARGPHRRPRLDPRHLGLLAHRHPLRPRHPPSTSPARSLTDWTQGPGTSRGDRNLVAHRCPVPLSVPRSPARRGGRGGAPAGPQARGGTTWTAPSTGARSTAEKRGEVDIGNSSGTSPASSTAP